MWTVTGLCFLIAEAKQHTATHCNTHCNTMQHTATHGSPLSPRPIECLKLQVIFRKRATNYRALLRKMTDKDKASSEDLALQQPHTISLSLSLSPCLSLPVSLSLSLSFTHTHFFSLPLSLPLSLSPTHTHHARAAQNGRQMLAVQAARARAVCARHQSAYKVFSRERLME